MPKYLLCLALLILPGSALAQRPQQWQLSAGVTMVSFSHAASTSGEAGESHVRAAPGMTVGAWLTRRFGGWELRAGADLLSSNVQLLDDAVALEVRSPGLSRRRLELLASRAVARLGDAELLAGGGGALDLWSPPAEGTRARGGLTARLALRLDAGRFAIENSVSGSLSPSLFAPSDLPEGYRQHGFRAVSAGFEVRVGL